MKSEIKYGAIIAGIGFVWNTFEYLLGFHTSKIDWHLLITVFFPIVILAVMFLGIRKKQNAGELRSFGKIFQFGNLIGIYAAIFSVAFGFLFYQFVNPTFFDDMKIAGREWIMMSASSDQEASNSILMMEDMFSLKAHLFAGSIFTLLVGLVGGLLFGLILKKR